MEPNEEQLVILEVVWSEGAWTLREVWKQLGKNSGYTSILKLMQEMHKTIS